LTNNQVPKQQLYYAPAVGHASYATDFAMGIRRGAAYRAVSRKAPLAETGYGLLFGAGLWAIADEIIVPAIGLSKWAPAYPASTHVFGMASHLVFGVATDRTIKLVEKAMGKAGVMPQRRHCLS
jgi:hypothetical protein